MAFNHSYRFYNLSCISTSLCGSLYVFLPLILPPLRPLTCHSLLTNLSLTNQPLCKSFTLPFSHPADAFQTGIRNMRLTTLQSKLSLHLVGPIQPYCQGCLCSPTTTEHLADQACLTECSCTSAPLVCLWLIQCVIHKSWDETFGNINTVPLPWFSEENHR